MVDLVVVLHIRELLVLELLDKVLMAELVLAQDPAAVVVELVVQELTEDHQQLLMVA
jgi:hypothetical protein